MSTYVAVAIGLGALYAINRAEKIHHRARAPDGLEVPEHSVNHWRVLRQLGPSIHGGGTTQSLSGLYSGDGASRMNSTILSGRYPNREEIGIGKDGIYDDEDRIKMFYEKYYKAQEVAQDKANFIVEQSHKINPVRIGNDHKPQLTSWIGEQGVEYGVTDVFYEKVMEIHDSQNPCREPADEYIDYMNGDITKKPPQLIGVATQKRPNFYASFA